MEALVSLHEPMGSAQGFSSRSQEQSLLGLPSDRGQGQRVCPDVHSPSHRRQRQGRISAHVSESCGALLRNSVVKGAQALQMAIQVDTGRDFLQLQLGTGRHM